MNTRRVTTVTAVLVIGLAIGALSVSLWTKRTTRVNVGWLFSNNPQQVAQALDMFRPTESQPMPLLLREPELVKEVSERLGTIENPTASAAFELISEAGLWDPEVIGEATWCHVLHDLLDQADREDEYYLYSTLVNLERLEDVLDADKPSERTVLLWDALLNAIDPAVRRSTVRSIVTRWPDGSYAKDVIRRCVDDEDPALRRLAWLIRGHMTLLEPLTGFSMRLEDPDPTVIEAMLWATVVTNPDQASSVLQHATDHELCHIGVIEYLRHRVAGTTTSTAPPLSNLHIIWETREITPTLFVDPIASDGSIWAMVLLADRCLDDEAAKSLALEWLHELHDDTILAGALLALLQDREIAEISREARHGSDSLKRMLDRLQPSSFEFRFPTGQLGKHNSIDVLLAAIISGPSGAIDTMIEWESMSAIEHLTTFGWFYERFTPELHALVMPLNVHDEPTAQLQRDLLTTAWWMRQRDLRFDRIARLWRHAATVGAPDSDTVVVESEDSL